MDRTPEGVAHLIVRWRTYWGEEEPKDEGHYILTPLLKEFSGIAGTQNPVEIDAWITQYESSPAEALKRLPAESSYAKNTSRSRKKSHKRGRFPVGGYRIRGQLSPTKTESEIPETSHLVEEALTDEKISQKKREDFEKLLKGWGTFDPRNKPA